MSEIKPISVASSGRVIAASRQRSLQSSNRRDLYGGKLFLIDTMPQAHDSTTLAHLDNADAEVTYALHILRECLHRCTAVHFDVMLDGRDLSGEYHATSPAVLEIAMQRDALEFAAPAC